MSNLLFGHARGGIGAQHGINQDEDNIQRGQEKPGDQGAHKQFAHRDAHDVTEDDKSNARGNDLAKGAGRADGSGGQLMLISFFQHQRQ